MSQDAQKNFDTCVVSVAAANQSSKLPKEAAQKACAGSFSWAERRTSLILSGLAEMVRHPPLPADAPPTAENSQQWKDWWVKNRDEAVFVIPPRQSYDWHQPVRKPQSELQGSSTQSSQHRSSGITLVQSVWSVTLTLLRLEVGNRLVCPVRLAAVPPAIRTDMLSGQQRPSRFKED